MSSDKVFSAVICFLHDFQDTEKEWLRSQQSVITDTDILLIAQDEFADMNLPFTAHQPPVQIKGNIVESFYQSKLAIDENLCDDVVIISSRSQVSAVNTLCHALFTPVYQWKLVSSNTEPTSSTRNECIEIQLLQYISTVPGQGSIKYLTSPIIPDDIFYHGFCERNGGISTIPGMRSLNFVYTNSKKDPQCVIEENRKRLSEKVPFDKTRLQVARAVHGNSIFVVGKEQPYDGYDGVLTNTKQTTCAAPGADCIIMLFADPLKKVCGAIHSGWKGTVARICSEMVKIMIKNFGSDPKDILVIMGPSICKNCFEFGIEDSKIFNEISPECVIWTNGKTNKPTIDLKLANRILLEGVGVHPDHIDDKSSAMCTVENPGAFFSYRRDGRPFGNQIGFIGLK